MKKIQLAVVLTGALLVAPLCFSDIAFEPTQQPVAGAITLAAPATITGYSNLAAGGQLWLDNEPLTNGLTLSKTTFQAKEFTLTLPDSTYQKLTIDKSFDVFILLNKNHKIKLTFVPQKLADNSVVLITTDITYR